MKAISVRQPWAWAICHAGKRVENREWQHAPKYRGPILIHAAKGCTQDEYYGAADAVRRIGRGQGESRTVPTQMPWLKDLPRGGIVGQANLVDVRPTSAEGHRVDIKAGRCLLCGEDLWRAPGAKRAPCPKPDPWAVPGQLGLILAEVEPMPLVPMKGMLGLFDVKGEELRAVVHALGGTS